MDSKPSNLEEFLNDESFIRWVKEESSKQEKQKWDRWLAENSETRTTVRKAKKIIRMPFIKDFPNDNEEALRTLQKRVEELNSQ
ncbi:MAG TPA: hypothetical protein VE868_00640 [Balneolaceae bacterium]|nr:hypothetical protein [Balneolaceae bacterium]